MSRKVMYLVVLFAFLLIPATAVTAAEPAPAAATEAAPAVDPAAPAVPDVQGDLGEVGTPEPTPMCGACTGTLMYFVEPSCRTCNINEFACDSACADHGGTQVFACGPSVGVYCKCQDGVYDSCGCGNDPY